MLSIQPGEPNASKEVKNADRRSLILRREKRGDAGITGRLSAYHGGRQVSFRYQDKNSDIADNAPGELVDASKMDLRTAERHDLGNKPNVSCIPWGDYKLEKRAYGGFHARYEKRFGHEFVPWIRGCEPKRSAILIHVGNNPEDDSQGCVLVGMTANAVGGTVGRSVDAYKALYEWLAAIPDECWPLPFNIVDEVWKSGECVA